MEHKRKVITVSCFVALIALIIALTCGVIVASPVEITKNTAGNFICNLMNDGYVLEDDGFLFYSNPENGVLYRAESNHTDVKPVKIAENCKGYLQVVNDTYFFQQGENLVSCDYEGNNLKTVVKNTNQPLVVGGSVYFLNESGSICKYSMRYDSVSDLKIKPTGKYLVYFNKIYYGANDGLYTSATDGTNVQLFLNEKVKNFSIDDKYLFYTTDKGTYSAVVSSGELKSTKITDASDFFVILSSSTMIYNNGKTVDFADMNKLNKDSKYKPVTLKKTGSKYIYGDDKYFYWFDDNGSLCRINSDNTGGVIFK